MPSRKAYPVGMYTRSGGMPSRKTRYGQEGMPGQ